MTSPQNQVRGRRTGRSERTTAIGIVYSGSIKACTIPAYSHEGNAPGTLCNTVRGSILVVEQRGILHVTKKSGTDLSARVDSPHVAGSGLKDIWYR